MYIPNELTECTHFDIWSMNLHMLKCKSSENEVCLTRCYLGADVSNDFLESRGAIRIVRIKDRAIKVTQKGNNGPLLSNHIKRKEAEKE